VNGYTASTVAELDELAGYRLAGVTFDTFPVDCPARVAALELARVADRDSLSLYLHGGYGSGKTGLALAIGRNTVSEFCRVTFVVVHQWLARARVGFSRGETLELELPDDVAVLIVDDLGAERPTDWGLETLAALVDGAHRRTVPIVATSNYAPAELAGRLTTSDEPHAGGRIVSRLLEDAEVLELDAPDLRRRTPATAPLQLVSTSGSRARPAGSPTRPRARTEAHLVTGTPWRDERP
jgi:DNA replication protein DnaC